MTKAIEPLQAIPTNIITGFLGVGKTSAILHLLKNKPEQERWAVLVNEFGEIGVDGALFGAKHSEQTGVYISEVPGGCMCCAAGLPMKIALNELIRHSKPDRLLIEPTGLGHPKEVLKALSESHYQSVLDIQKTITLVDARNLAEPRYTEHETFNQQIVIADIVVGNKADLYGEQDQHNLESYVAQLSQAQVEIVLTEFGAVDYNLLEGKTGFDLSRLHHRHHHQSSSRPLASEQEFPSSGVIKAVNEGEGFISVGWRIVPSKIFSYEKARQFVEQTNSERLKAVFITEKGIYSYNKTREGIQEWVLDEYPESRIEIISQKESPHWSTDLFNCLA
ncbi:GTP-binding protein [Reinekea forsetii]|nr:GTP-binding protein [Reinekea forsetii]